MKYLRSKDILRIRTFSNVSLGPRPACEGSFENAHTGMTPAAVLSSDTSLLVSLLRSLAGYFVVWRNPTSLSALCQSFSRGVKGTSRRAQHLFRGEQK